MAGSVTKTEASITRGTRIRVSLAWLCDASGVVSANSVNIPQNGTVISCTFKPNGGGTAPTDLYDVVLTNDTTAVDELNGAGANLSGTVATTVALVYGSGSVRRFLPAGGYTLGVTNAGNAKGGLVELIIARNTVL
jgi:hypothetical protein